jgi:GxxExxY protein
MDATPLLHEELTGTVRQTAFEVHRYLGPGFLEKVYENALLNRLRKKGVRVEPQHGILVHDEDGTVIGEYGADLFVEECVVVEIKAAKSLSAHMAQVLNYLKATRIRLGLLINFGASKLEFRRFISDPASVCSVFSVAKDPPNPSP